MQRGRFESKAEWLGQFTRGRRVLYLGSVDDDPGNLAKHRDLHARLAPAAGSLLGAYHRESVAAALTAQGLPSVSMAAETPVAGPGFDVIVAADNLEHMPDGGSFLRTVARHLAPEGVLLVTTPNPTSLVRILETLILGRAKTNPAHTCWFTPQVLAQLAARCGLSLVQTVFIDDMAYYHPYKELYRSRRRTKALAALILNALNRTVCAGWPQFSETFGAVLARPGRPWSGSHPAPAPAAENA